MTNAQKCEKKRNETVGLTYSVSQKKIPLRFSDIFSQIVRNFQSKFYALITRSYLRWSKNLYPIVFNFDEVMPYLARPPSQNRMFKMSNVHVPAAETHADIF